MKSIQFNSLDLNLLRIFDVLMEEQSVTRAGDRLGVTPSAVSHALGRLRHLLNDDLFRRGPDGMRPTPFATEIGPRLHRLLSDLRSALAPSDFVPTQTDRRFTIFCRNYLGMLLLPSVVARLRVEAPLADVRIWSTDAALPDQLEDGRIDFAIGAFGRSSDHYSSEVLLKDELVWAVSDSNRLAGKRLTLETLAKLPHVKVSTAQKISADGYLVMRDLERPVIWADERNFESALSKKGLRRAVALTVPDGALALAIVAKSDMTALVPRRLGEALAKHHRLKLYAPPYESEPFEIKTLWHRNSGAQPAIAWLRGVFHSVAAAL